MGRKKKVGGQEPSINMTPMIDVVFQMIIFFVTTADMDRKAFDEKIRLALSPHGPAVEDKDPRTVTIEVDKNGRIQFGRGIYVSTDYLRAIMRKTVAEFGQTVPVVIRADGDAKHSDVKRVMDACSMAGLWKIKFAATKEQAENLN